MRSTNINFKRGILFFVYNATCWLEKCPAVNIRVLYLESLQQLLPLLFLGRLRQLLLSPMIGQRERESEREKREKEREKSERRWILGYHSLAEVEVRTKISVEVVLTAPFTDLSKGGDTIAPPIENVSKQCLAHLSWSFFSLIYTEIRHWL